MSNIPDHSICITCVYCGFLTGTCYKTESNYVYLIVGNNEHNINHKHVTECVHYITSPHRESYYRTRAAVKSTLEDINKVLEPPKSKRKLMII